MLLCMYRAARSRDENPRQLRLAEWELEQIFTLVEQFAGGPLSEDGFVAFEERFWQAVARAGGNRILQMETNWWYRVLAERPRPESLVPSPLATRVGFYVELATRLRA